jgi:phosphatidate cytidylyltransferase
LLTRILTALPLIAGFLAALLWASPELWQGIIAAILWIGGVEWARLARLENTAAYLFASVLVLIGLTVGWLLPGQPWVFVPCALFWVAAPWLFQQGTQLTQKPLLLTLGMLILPTTYLAFIELRQHAPYLLLAIVGLVAVADSSAYFAGRQFGKHKLAPTISPGKTWEGVAGAILGVSLYIALLWQLWGQNHLPTSLPVLLVIAWGLLALSIMGDLFESQLKRQAGVKDSGNLLPGHGGVLDRIDSLTAALPVAALLWWMQ